MTDLDRKLEEIAREALTDHVDCEDPVSMCTCGMADRNEAIKKAVQAASQATARYCAEIVKAVPERGWDENHPQASWMNGYVAGFDMAAETILRECGVKE